MASNITNPGSVGPPPQQPQPPQQPPQPTQPQASIPQQQLSDNDPLVKYQTLLPILKESVVNLIKNTVAILQNISSGQCKQSEMQSLNKCLEDFYNISDQVGVTVVIFEPAPPADSIKQALSVCHKSSRTFRHRISKLWPLMI